MSFHGILSGSPLMGFFGEGLYSTRPLQRIVARQVDQTMLADIAVAHRQGRRLFVVTTNLDAQRPVLWNMGAIAASERPGALELFRKVLLASASVPGLFDPVFIDAEANGHHFKEIAIRIRSRQWSPWRQLATSSAAPLSVSRCPPIHRLNASIEASLNGTNRTQAGSLCYITPSCRHCGRTAIAPGAGCQRSLDSPENTEKRLHMRGRARTPHLLEPAVKFIAD
jgi:hypothetical protein